MYALVLEGGGSRGAYQAGALKAFFEAGYKFDIVVGTSIGAINGAMIAQNDFNKLYTLWKNIQFSNVMDLDDNKINRILKKNIDMSVIKYIGERFRTTLKNKGVSTRKIRKIIEENVIEEKLRNSNVDFGLVTYSLTDKKPVEIFLKNIPKGHVANYLLASSRLPIFKSESFENKYYIDGGVYNNCPVNMIDTKKHKNIVIIRTNPKGKIKDLEKIQKIKDVNITIIKPNLELPKYMNFNNSVINEMIDIGYYDTLKYLENLDGVSSYIRPIEEEKVFSMLINFSKEKVEKIAELLNIKVEMNYLKLLFEIIIPILTSKIGYKYTKGYKEAVIVIVEYVAKLENIYLYTVYDFDELVNKVKEKIRFKDKNNFDKAICEFVKNIELK